LYDIQHILLILNILNILNVLNVLNCVSPWPTREYTTKHQHKRDLTALTDLHSYIRPAASMVCDRNRGDRAGNWRIQACSE
jgi:hypothetical protein